MNMDYDDKGKIFTDVISKDAVRSTIQTLTHRLRGSVYIRPGARIKDELAQADRFIAVTDATVFDAEGMELFRTDFLVLNLEHIVWLIPDEDLVKDQMKESPDE